MRSERLAVIGLLLLMIAVGGAAWWLQLRPPLHADYAPLATVPLEIGSWSGSDVPLDTRVETMLNADFNLQRTYRRGASEPVIWFYLGYYGTGRGGRPEHVPGDCYPSAGWRIEQDRIIDVDPDRSFRANEFVVSQQGHRRLVHFWYRSSRRTGMVDELSLGLDHLTGKLRGGRADGALVRLSTPIEGDGEIGARARLLGFARRVDPLLGERWPREFSTGDR